VGARDGGVSMGKKFVRWWTGDDEKRYRQTVSFIKICFIFNININSRKSKHIKIWVLCEKPVTVYPCEELGRYL
jgi:hypothetical protein